MQLNTSKKNEINNHPHLENIILSQIERYYVNFYLILKVIVHLGNKIVKFLKVMDTSLQLELGVGQAKPAMPCYKKWGENIYERVISFPKTISNIHTIEPLL